MAPLPDTLNLPDLSAELDTRSSPARDLASYLSSLSLAEREALTNPDSSHLIVKRDDLSILSPIEVHSALTARDRATTNGNYNPGSGAISPDSINNKGIQALFGLIGVFFVVVSIWFFFWAKNGGFQWRKGDWDDYKSTVLRRKGPNGTTLSNATKSTRLGGGSVVGGGYSDHDGTMTDTMTDTMTELSSEAPVLKEKQKQSKVKNSNKQNNAKKETAREKKIREVKESQWEGGHDNDVRAYRHEKVARVGGLNKDSDAMHYGTDYSQTDSSVTNQQPRSSHHGQRHSSHSRHSSPEKRDRASRRDFSYGQEGTFSVVSDNEPRRPARYHSPSKNSTPRSARQSAPSNYTEPLDFDVQSQNTISYHHPIPGLSGQQRGGGGGFRRGRGEGLDD